jgi:hypothetical protein
MKDAFSARVQFSRLSSMIRIMPWSDRILRDLRRSAHPTLGCLPNLYPPSVSGEEDREPVRRPAGHRGVVGQETGTWGEGAGEGRTGAGGTERSTPSD